MTDKADPRLDALTSALTVQWGKGWMNDDGKNPSDVLADLDAADRAAGIVRVDTNDKALGGEVAGVFEDHIMVNDGECLCGAWDKSVERWRDHKARAVLAALREQAP